MRVTVDVERCCAGGMCALIAPEVFDQDDDGGVVVLLQADPARELHEPVREAAAACPRRAIEVIE